MCSGQVLGHWCRVVDVVDARGTLERIGDLRENGGEYSGIIASMTPAERNYSISDKEALVIVKALQHWRHWLEGTKVPIEILTDHKNLEYFTKPRVLNR